LQLYVGAENVILLPLRCTATILHLDDETVSIYRRAAQKEGLLEEVQPYQPKRSATKFRFNLVLLKEILAHRGLGDCASCVVDSIDDIPRSTDEAASNGETPSPRLDDAVG